MAAVAATVRAMASGIYWLMAALFVLAGFVLWARRRFVGYQDKPHHPRKSGFSMQRLEKMLAEGRISPEEFAVLRKEVLRSEVQDETAAGSASSAPCVHDDGTTGSERG